MKKKCYENPSVKVVDLLEVSVLMLSNVDKMNTEFEYDNSEWL